MSKSNNLKDFLTDLANAIRTKKGTTEAINPQNFSSEIAGITTGITPSGELEVTENGTHDVTNYASVNVNVASTGGSGESVAAIYEAATDDEMTSYASAAYDGSFVKFTGTTGTYVNGRTYKVEKEAPYKFTVTSISSDCSILAEDGTVITAGQSGEFYAPTRTVHCSGGYSSHSLSGTNVEILGSAEQLYYGNGIIILLNDEAAISFTGTNSSGGAF